MTDKNKFRKPVLGISVIINLLMLGIFKYAGFSVDMLNFIPGVNIPVPNIALPIGISFYTFQAMSYVIDAYRSPDYIQRNLFKLALYITFFPQLIAGPIIKYHDFAELLQNRRTTPEMTAKGIRRFITGLSKKLLIADTIAIAADYVYGLDNSQLSLPLAWLGAVSYMLQIYFDFSGYSDMAIGLGSMFGFTFKENFNYPYISSSMQDFWRRWHISVSTWFKEYLYIPLGGNRCGKLRTALNKLIVFFCTGLWHGASLNFIVWGLINGGFMMLESYKIINTERWFKPLRHIYALIVTVTAFVFFRADTLSDACVIIGNMFNPFTQLGGSSQTAMLLSQLSPIYITALTAAVVFSMPVWNMLSSKVTSKGVRIHAETAYYIISLVMLLLCIITLSSNSYSPFIYLRF